MYPLSPLGDSITICSDQRGAGENPKSLPCWPNCWPHGHQEDHQPNYWVFHVAWDSERCEGNGTLNIYHSLSVHNIGWLNYYCYLDHVTLYVHLYSQITTCDACEQTNCQITTATPELHPVSVKAPRYHVGIDFVGPITSDSGNRYAGRWQWKQHSPPPSTASAVCLV